MSSQTEAVMLKEIARKFGRVIDLEETPSVLAEILRVYGGRFAGGPLVEGSGGVMIGGGGTVYTQRRVEAREPGAEGSAGTDATLSEVMRGVLQLQREVNALNSRMDEITSFLRTSSSSPTVQSKPKASFKSKPKGGRS